MLTLCPLCSAVCKDHVPASPYWKCPNCDVWMQDPAPPKLYHGEHEAAPELMSDGDKAINDSLAGWLFDNVMKGKPGLTLDVGAAYPYLASRLKARGCDALAIDGESTPHDLDVDFQTRDFETMKIRDSRDEDKFEGHALITMIHNWEHMYRPLDAMRKLRGLLADDGRLFIRMPDHNVPGIERDMTPGHFTIHPFVHTLSSILQCCAETHAFEVESYVQIQPGQADIVLRPINSIRTLGVGMIVKNEERDLPRALQSVTSIADALTIIDTGSTDRTMEIADKAGAHVSQYTGASTKDANGDWKLDDFSAARNIAIDSARVHNTDWYMTLDADDVLITPDAIKRAMYWAEKDCFTVWIQAGTTKWVQHRLWKSSKGVKFSGRCHEYPILDGLNIGQLDDALIVHHADPNPGESSNARNLRILMLEWGEKQTPRTAFYIANTHKDGGRQKDAAQWYQVRIDMGEGFRDEWLFSWLYMGRAMRTYDPDLAALTLQNAMNLEPTWMEFRMELAFILFQQKHYAQAVAMAHPAIGYPIQQTVLWREPQMYRDQPARLISFCHENLGNVALALEFAKLAKEKIGAPDLEWDQRINNLEKKGAPAIIGKAREVICVRRPGAIGDVIMTLNLIPALRAANPGKDVWYFSDPSLIADDALGWLMREAGCDQVMASNTFDSWSSRCARAIDLVGYPLAEGYPDKPMQTHLLEYFGEELGLWTALRNIPIKVGDLPALTVRRPQVPGGFFWKPYITMQMNAGWSRYKQWDENKWNAVIAHFDFDVVMIDASYKRTLAESIALFANASMHIGIDSFCNHLTNYFWTYGDHYEADGEQFAEHGRKVPGVILWGSTQASAAGYPSNTNISLGLPCQPCFRENPAISRMPRGPCINVLAAERELESHYTPATSYDDPRPHACMDGISVEQVVEAVKEMWERVK